MSNWRSYESSTPAQRAAIVARARKAAISLWGEWDGKCVLCGSSDNPFPKHSRTCRKCISKKSLAYYHANREKVIRQRRRRWQRKSRDPEFRERERLRAAINRQKAREQR